MAQPAHSELSRDDGLPAASGPRRITPIPLGAATALPVGEERSASVARKGGGGGGGSIAALAAALGKQAAQSRAE